MVMLAEDEFRSIAYPYKQHHVEKRKRSKKGRVRRLIKSVQEDGRITWKVPLLHGRFALIDDVDYNLISPLNWSFSTEYAVNGKVGTMARYIMKPPKELYVDHINCDALDNRRCNLRIVTASQNNKNRRTTAQREGGYRGIAQRRSGIWWAMFGTGETYKMVGPFQTAEEAALAYNEGAKLLYGEFACLNVIK